MIAIIDYGMGNLHSVSKAVERLGYEAHVTGNRERIMEASAAILPGVGAFGDAMRNLQAAGLRDAVTEYARSGKPLLGICLGMQLLFSESEEHGLHQGLNLLPGRVVRLGGQGKIPHMGWNRLTFHRDNELFEDVEEGVVYFVHSYKALPAEEHLLASTEYYEPVAAVVGRDRVYGMQFHPEKSGALGMRLLANFLKLSKRAGHPSA